MLHWPARICISETAGADASLPIVMVQRCREYIAGGGGCLLQQGAAARKKTILFWGPHPPCIQIIPKWSNSKHREVLPGNSQGAHYELSMALLSCLGTGAAGVAKWVLLYPTSARQMLEAPWEKGTGRREQPHAGQTLLA